MRLFTIAAGLLAMSVTTDCQPTARAEHSLEKRDLATIEGTLNTLTDQLKSLTTTVNGFDGDVNKAVPVLDGANAALKTMRDGRAKIAATQDSLSLVDTIDLLVTLFTLDRGVAGVTTALVSKKPQFETAGVGFVVADQLKSFDGAATELVDVVVDHLPFFIPRPLASLFYSPILNKLAEANSAFSSNSG